MSGHDEGPLAAAIVWGLPDTVELLQERGADINVRDPSGLTPLHRLLTRLPPEGRALDAMLAHGADINDCRGRTVLYEAARLGEEETVRLLLQRGADPNLRGWDASRNGPGASALETAKLGDSKRVIRMLLDAGATG